MADDWRGKSAMEEGIGIHWEIGGGVEVEAALDLDNHSLASCIPQGAAAQRGGGLPGGEYLREGGAHKERIALASFEFKCRKWGVMSLIGASFPEPAGESAPEMRLCQFRGLDRSCCSRSQPVTIRCVNLPQIQRAGEDDPADRSAGTRDRLRLRDEQYRPADGEAEERLGLPEFGPAL